MGEKRKRGRPRHIATEGQEEVKDEGNKDEVASGYEQFRDQRIKENMERLQKLGILDLSRKLKPESKKKRPQKNPSEKKSSLPPSEPPRRSSRLESVARVVYVEKRTPKKEKAEEIEINIKEGSKPEVYTEEDLRLLGDCKTAWILMVDGYGEDEERIYDPFYGKSCHQCRQKTLGHRTSCSKCTSVQGKFCGDCLYTRYGENVLEANQNLSWVCPVCRGICNCSRCRRAKGWAPTSALYRKVTRLGFKSVAHYLIQHRQFRPKQDEPAAEGSVSADKSPSMDIEAKSPLHDEDLELLSSPDGIPNPQSEDGNNVKEDDSDDEYEEQDEDEHDSSDDESDEIGGDD